MSNAYQRFEHASQSYEEICILGATAELDLLTPLTQSAMSAAELTKLRATDLRATVMVLDALTSLGFLEKSADTQPLYRVAAEYRELLDINHPNTFVPMLRHRLNCIRQWVEMSRTIKSGKPMDRVVSPLGAEEDYRSFVLAMNSVGIAFAAKVVDNLEKIGLLQFKHLLDVGGASGTYTLAMLERNPSAQATIFDRPAAIEEAKKRFAGTRFASQLHYASGDFDYDELPAGTDFAWVSAIIHQFGRETSQSLYRKIYRALDAGGTIAVRDHILDATRTKPTSGLLFAINMLTATQTGMCYTFDEVKEDLETAGFSNVCFAVPTDDMGSIVTAKK
ncbi:MAG: methyltransferase domain-containing protein [Planctomycetaceae bacterium]|jgi:ubiquinone/menaquinone biosynthesis C-methylase UbiE|nr:methyltransferase domain-containing protein [Planctomycetaceae bacterium]